MDSWRDLEPTLTQIAYIIDMQSRSVYSLPPFEGTTRGEAADYIRKYSEFAHANEWAITHGYDI